MYKKGYKHLVMFLFFSCTVAILDLDILKNEYFTLPGGCRGMMLKDSYDDEELKSASYVSSEGCEAYFTSRYVIIIYCKTLNLEKRRI